LTGNCVYPYIPTVMTLREARRNAGLTQAQLAKRAHVDQRTISALERKQIAEPSHFKVVCICRVLGVNPQSIDEFRVEAGKC
jgi:transcriptional regulator with XRE-family HTH domain